MSFRNELKRAMLDGVLIDEDRSDIDKLKAHFAKIVLPTKAKLLKLASKGEPRHQIYYLSDYECADVRLLQACFTYVHGTELFEGLPYKFGLANNFNDFYVYVEWATELATWNEST